MWCANALVDGLEMKLRKWCEMFPHTHNRWDNCTTIQMSSTALQRFPRISYGYPNRWVYSHPQSHDELTDQRTQWRVLVIYRHP